MAITSRNPATGQVVKEFDELTTAELENKLAQAELAFKNWRQTSMKERGRLMHLAASTLRSRALEFAHLMTLEMGKITSAGLAEVEKCALTCDFYADNAEKFLEPVNITSGAKESYVRFEPLGPILAIMPWNFPFWQVIRFAAPTLMAGNVGLLKHASNVPQCALAIEDVFIKSGFPVGVFQTLLVAVESIDTIISDDRICAVTLTGSEKAGSLVGSSAGRAIKKTVLELGGSDPFIVLKDADLVQAAKIAILARMQNNAGQSCIAAKRFIVEASVAKSFTDLLTEQFKLLDIGNPNDDRTQVGPLATEEILKTVSTQVISSISMGAKLQCGGKQLERPGNFYEPTILSEVTPDMPVFNEEVFGPVAAVIAVQDRNEAVALANSSRYGLGATIFTRDIEIAKKMAGEIECGAVFINGMVRSDPALPFGGVKKSGYGRELGSFGIKEFVNIKTVVIN